MSDGFDKLNETIETLNNELEELDNMSREDLMEFINNYDWDAVPDDGLRGFVYTLQILGNRAALTDIFGMGDELYGEENESDD